MLHNAFGVGEAGVPLGLNAVCRLVKYPPPYAEGVPYHSPGLPRSGYPGRAAAGALLAIRECADPLQTTKPLHITKSETRNSKQIRKGKLQRPKRLRSGFEVSAFDFRACFGFGIPDFHVPLVGIRVHGVRGPRQQRRCRVYACTGGLRCDQGRACSSWAPTRMSTSSRP